MPLVLARGRAGGLRAFGRAARGVVRAAARVDVVILVVVAVPPTTVTVTLGSGPRATGARCAVVHLGVAPSHLSSSRLAVYMAATARAEARLDERGAAPPPAPGILVFLLLAAAKVDHVDTPTRPARQVCPLLALHPCDAVP